LHRFQHEGAVRVGAVQGESLRPFATGTDLIDLLDDAPAREAALAGAGAALAPDDVRLLEPYRRDDRLHLELTVSVNGEEFGSDTLANMAWSFEEMAAYASRGTRIVPGDVLGSGTCGTGCYGEIWGRTQSQSPPPLTAGDVVEMTVEGIGTIRNRLVARAELETIAAARSPQHRRLRSH
jgi:hypothetical protein